MWRAKKLIALLTALLLLSAPGLAKDDYVEAYLGDYREIGKTDGRIVYTTRVTLTFAEGEDARMCELYVKNGTEVRQGDPIASFTVAFDEAAYLAAERSLLRTRESAMEGTADYLTRLAALTERIDSTYNRAQKTSLQYEMRILQAEFDRYRASVEEDVAEQEAALAELALGREPVLLLAPIDGVIASLTTIRPGESVTPADVIAEVYDPESRAIAVSDSKGQLRYNMQVEISFSDGKTSVPAVGHVVSARDVLPGGVDDGMAYIRYEEPEEKYPTLYIHLTYSAVTAENVLLVPYSAVSMENGLYYVYILAPDGTRQKRYVNLGGHADGIAWVLQGLEAGDVVID